MVRSSRSQELLNFGGNASEAIPPVTPNMKLWSFAKARLVIGAELLAVQGSSRADLKGRNKLVGDRRLQTLAGEGFSQYSYAIYTLAVMSVVEL